LALAQNPRLLLLDEPLAGLSTEERETVRFAVPKGKILGLLGRNGVGKTTCISTIAGMMRARGGTILLGDRRVESLGSEAISRSGIGLVPQGRRVFPSLTVQENLSVARRGPQPRWTVQTVFELFPRLRERRRQLAGWLSGGEQQMLAIGRALMGNPTVLLMDEPSEGLAPLIVAEVARTIAGLRNEGMSILLVEQNIRLALELADRIVILSAGSCVFAGDVTEVRSRPELIETHLGVATRKPGQ
jgi:branched-chain amino acid transport system ATP-binding protein